MTTRFGPNKMPSTSNGQMMQPYRPYNWLSKADFAWERFKLQVGVTMIGASAAKSQEFLPQNHKESLAWTNKYIILYTVSHVHEYVCTYANMQLRCRCRFHVHPQWPPRILRRSDFRIALLWYKKAWQLTGQQATKRLTSVSHKLISIQIFDTNLFTGEKRPFLIPILVHVTIVSLLARARVHAWLQEVEITKGTDCFWGLRASSLAVSFCDKKCWGWLSSTSFNYLYMTYLNSKLSSNICSPAALLGTNPAASAGELGKILNTRIPCKVQNRSKQKMCRLGNINIWTKLIPVRFSQSEQGSAILKSNLFHCFTISLVACLTLCTFQGVISHHSPQ